MGEVVVTGGEDQAEAEELEAVHAAGAAEGAAEVHKEQAEDAAAEAEAFAAAAATAVQIVGEAGAAAEGAAADATEAAEVAVAAESAIVAAINQQTLAIESLVQELRDKQASSSPPVPEGGASAPSKPDRAPATGKRTFRQMYYGKGKARRE